MKNTETTINSENLLYKLKLLEDKLQCVKQKLYDMPKIKDSFYSRYQINKDLTIIDKKLTAFDRTLRNFDAWVEESPVTTSNRCYVKSSE